MIHSRHRNIVITEAQRRHNDNCEHESHNTASSKPLGRDRADATYVAILLNYGNLKYDPSNPHGNGEANLDIQYAQGIAYATPIVFYSVGLAGDGWVDWLESVIDLPRPPQTIGISYSSEEKGFQIEYTTYVCFLFEQFAARGISVLSSTGNNGVSRDCIHNDDSFRFSSTLPATRTCVICPRLTSSE